MKVKFKEWLCELDLSGRYGNGRIAIGLIDAEEGDTVTVATINVPEALLEKDEVVIKDYAENEGMVETLYQAGIISEPIGYVSTGYVSSPVCKLLINPE